MARNEGSRDLLGMNRQRRRPDVVSAQRQAFRGLNPFPRRQVSSTATIRRQRPPSAVPRKQESVATSQGRAFKKGFLSPQESVKTEMKRIQTLYTQTLNEMPDVFKKILQRGAPIRRDVAANVDRETDNLAYTYRSMIEPIFFSFDEKGRPNYSHYRNTRTDEGIKNIIRHELLHNVLYRANFIDPNFAYPVGLRGKDLQDYINSQHRLGEFSLNASRRGQHATTRSDWEAIAEHIARGDPLRPSDVMGDTSDNWYQFVE